MARWLHMAELDATMIDCKGCAERREKIKAHLKAMAEWIKNPRTASLPFPSSITPPPTPQIHGRGEAKKDP